MTDYRQIVAEIENLQLPEGRLDPAEVERSQRSRLQLALALEAHRSGYEVVTVDRIADTAMLSKATLYSLFASKTGLLSASVAEFAEWATARIIDSADEGENWEERTASGVEALLGAVAERPAMARLTFVEAPAVLPGARPPAGTVGSNGGAGDEAVDTVEIRLLGTIIDSAAGRAGAPPSGLEGLARTATLAGMAAPIADRLIRGRSAEVPALDDSLIYLAINAQAGPAAALAALSRRRPDP